VLITGNDKKVSIDENTGKTITHPAGKDTVSIIDIAGPPEPKNHRRSAADEHDHRTADQPSDHPRSAPGAGRPFA